MAVSKSPKLSGPLREQRRELWLAKLQRLLDTIDGWARELDWSTRRIEKRMEDSQLGTYKAPALLMQKETMRVLVEPIACSTPGTEGLVDLYLLPAYDDIASLYDDGDGWKLHHPLPGTPLSGDIRQTAARPLSRQSFADVLEELIQNAA